MGRVLTAEAAGRELAKVLRVTRREREKLADVTKEAKGRIAALEKRARELEDIANGAAVQVELDTGDDEPAPTTAAAIADALDRRPRKRRRAEDCGACGVAADQPSDGCEECSHGR